MCNLNFLAGSYQRSHEIGELAARHACGIAAAHRERHTADSLLSISLPSARDTEGIVGKEVDTGINADYGIVVCRRTRTGVEFELQFQRGGGAHEIERVVSPVEDPQVLLRLALWQHIHGVQLPELLARPGDALSHEDKVAEVRYPDILGSEFGDERWNNPRHHQLDTGHLRLQHRVVHHLVGFVKCGSKYLFGEDRGDRLRPIVRYLLVSRFDLQTSGVHSNSLSWWPSLIPPSIPVLSHRIRPHL